MLENEICEQPEQTDDWHARWLTMRSAYAEYRRSSEALECTRRADADSVPEDRLRLTILEGRQRVAFEQYLDARIGFLESRFDELARPDKILADSWAEPVERLPDSRLKALLSLASSPPVLQTLVVLLLCALTFSLVRIQTRVRTLVAGRDELRGAILQTSKEVQMLRQKLDSGQAQSAAPVRIERPATDVTPKTLQSRAGQPAEGTQQRAPRPAMNAKRTPASEGPGRTTPGRNIQAFSLVPSWQFKRVGPVSVLLRSVDAQTGTASLYIMTEATHVDLQRLRLDQPVWLKTSNHEQPLGLVVDRITKDRLDGYLVEAGPEKPDLRGTHFGPSVNSQL